jgi:hypothetical protein
MDPRYTYTPDDEMFPQYCRNCKKHIPAFVLDKNGNLCPECQLAAYESEQEMQKALAKKALEQQQAEQAQQFAVHQRNTGLGRCSQCQSTNLQQFDNVENHGNGRNLIGAGCFLSLLGIPAIFFFGLGFLLIAAGIVLFCVGLGSSNHRKVGTSRQCLACGNRWLV